MQKLSKLRTGSDPDYYANTDWLDAIMRTGHMQQHHVSVSGGTDKTHFMTSVNFSDQDGIMLRTGVRKVGFRSNVDSKYKRFTFGLNVSGNFNDVTSPGTSVGGEGVSCVIYHGLLVLPFLLATLPTTIMAM